MELLHWILWASCACLSVHCRFLSRPDLHPLPLTIHTNKLPSNDTDFIFITPYRSAQDGPAIYNLRGELVWDGHESSTSGDPIRTGNFQTVRYNGSTHLKFTNFEEKPHGPHHDTTHKILNNKYSTVAALRSLDPIMDLDGHDSEVLDEGQRFLQATKINYPAGTLSKGRVEEAVIQEYDLATKRISFEWRAFDHVALHDCCTFPDDPDYFHINSVQKDERGSYLANGFNICTTYYINGSSGAIIWTLGGEKSSFRILDENGDDYKLRHLHHVRIRPLSHVNLPESLKPNISPSTHLAISAFDNAYDAYEVPPTAPFSSALILLLDLVSRTAQIIERIPHPRGLTAAMFGSVNLLPNGDRYIGWGAARDVSQHTASGRLLFHAEIGDENTLIGSSRSFKAPWKGFPETRPDVYVYAWGCIWPNAVYVSWNGATEVRTYRVYGLLPDENGGGEFELVAEGAKDGFETRLATDRYVELVYVEAFDEEGGWLGTSSVVETYRPPLIKGRACSLWMCPGTLPTERANASCLGGEIYDGRRPKGQIVLGVE